MLNAVNNIQSENKVPEHLIKRIIKIDLVKLETTLLDIQIYFNIKNISSL